MEVRTSEVVGAGLLVLVLVVLVVLLVVASLPH
jgi:hypothetical protein